MARSKTPTRQRAAPTVAPADALGLPFPPSCASHRGMRGRAPPKPAPPPPPPPPEEPLNKPHTIFVAALLCAALWYALSDVSEGAAETSTRRCVPGGGARPLHALPHPPTHPPLPPSSGCWAVLAVGLTFFSQYGPDTLFIRPHPALWRAAVGVGFFYLLGLAFLLFQPLHVGRSLMRLVDPSLTATPLPQRSYGDSCELTWPNVEAALYDEFVLAHLIGWVFKAIMLRDAWLAWLLSFLFELMEYSFTWVQPNFAECWWDHWIVRGHPFPRRGVVVPPFRPPHPPQPSPHQLDFALCNAAGIVIGHALLQLLDSNTLYNWRGAASQPSSKLSRLLKPFTPNNWTSYEWAMWSNPRRFGVVVIVIVGTLLVELCAFFLKDIYAVPPTSVVNLWRLIVWWAICMPGLRDYYAFCTDSSVKKLGAGAWIMLCMMAMETLVVLRHGFMNHFLGKVPPPEVVWVWGVVLSLFGGGVALWFGWLLPRMVAKRLPLTLGAAVGEITGMDEVTPVKGKRA